MRIILYTGKGGVGKTSIAAATACKIASEGKKVLVVSTDQAHSLSDSFDTKLGNSPIRINKNLYSMEIDTVLETENSWGNIKNYIEKLIILKSENNIESEELLVFPGFDELLSLIKIKEIYDKNEYDVLIVDCAPTGETMSLLKFPELFKWWMEKIFPIKKKGAKLAGPIIETTMKIPMPNEEIFDDIEKMYLELDELHKLMTNKDEVSIRIVTTPEKIVVKEAKRSFSYLHLFDYNVDAVVINKIFPQKSLKGYFEKWEQIQQDSIIDIEESFNEIPVFRLELMPTELRGYQTLKLVGDSIYNEQNPVDIFLKEKIFTVESVDNGYVLRIKMPFVDKSELSMTQKGDELVISIKNERRCFVLPKKLQSREVIGARYEDGVLKVEFC